MSGFGTKEKKTNVFLVVIFLVVPLFLSSSQSITSGDSRYLDACARACSDENYFQHFKSERAYASIMELNGGGSFAKYLLQRGSPDVLGKLEEFRRLDDFGGPRTFVHPSLGRFSGTTLRYIVVADQILQLFTLPEKPTVVEIGAGFGGQCFVLSRLLSYQSYSIYDLPHPERLIEKMLTLLKVEHFCCLPLDAELPEECYDLCISNYAFSECERQVQLDYFERVMKKCARGYVIYNQISDLFHIDSMSPQEFVQLLEANGMHPQVYEEVISTFDKNLLVV